MIYAAVYPRGIIYSYDKIMERWKSSHRLRPNLLRICCCVSTSRDEGVFQLSQPYTDYGRATVESFEDAAKKCVITQGVDSYLLSMG